MTSNGKAQMTVQEVRAAFVARGTSLNRWAKSVGEAPQHVHMALTGKRRGPKARQLVEQVLSSVRGPA